MSLNQLVWPSLGAPWLGPGGGSKGGPGDPGYNHTGGSFQALCIDECGCSSSGKPYRCTDADTCEPGIPELHLPGVHGRELWRARSARRHAPPAGALRGVQPELQRSGIHCALWCDPADPACERGSATRAPLKVKILVSDWHRQSSSVVDIGISQSRSSAFVTASGQLRKDRSPLPHGQPSAVDGPW